MFSDSEQDYKLKRLVKVLNENYQIGRREVDKEHDTSSNQRETTDDNYMSHVADDDNTIEVLLQDGSFKGHVKIVATKSQ